MGKGLAAVMAAALFTCAGIAPAWCDVRHPRLAAADVPTPTAPPAVTAPTPQKSPGAAPLLPPEGLPTAPPPDAIKPVEPRAVQPAPDPASASGRVPAVRMLRSVSGGA